MNAFLKENAICLMKRPGNKNGWKILYHSAVVKKDIPHLNSQDGERIKSAIGQKLAVDPALYGIPLRGTLKQFWKLRIGNWRIVFTIANKNVYILVIANRKEVYKLAGRRR